MLETQISISKKKKKTAKQPLKSFLDLLMFLYIVIKSVIVIFIILLMFYNSDYSVLYSSS